MSTRSLLPHPLSLRSDGGPGEFSLPEGLQKASPAFKAPALFVAASALAAARIAGGTYLPSPAAFVEEAGASNSAAALRAGGMYLPPPPPPNPPRLFAERRGRGGGGQGDGRAGRSWNGGIDKT